MATFKQRHEQKLFVKQLETVSGDLANWAQEKFNWDWSLEDVKLALQNAAKLCDRD